MEAAKTLLRTAVRTFFSNPRQILIIDALLLHSVLHIEDLAILLNAQPKDIRIWINPLRSARLCSTHSRLEVRVGSTRGSPREYYYVPFHPAIDAIKYRIAKLRRKVETLYQQDETKRKDWRCPRCKSEYEQLEILGRVSDDGFYCERCGATLVQNEAEALAQDRGNHEKIRMLNTQLSRFDEMLARVDRLDIPANDFSDAWERKKAVPRDRERGYASRPEYVELKRDDKSRSMVKRQEVVDSKNLSINLTSGAERERELEEQKERRRQELAKQNTLPAWHRESAIGKGGDGEVKREPGGGSAIPTDGRDTPKREETDEKRVNVEEDKMQDALDAYRAEILREQEEQARQEQEDEEEDEEDEDFEDVDVNASTPMSSQQSVSTPLANVRLENGHGGASVMMMRANGTSLKRELDLDGGGSSGVSSDANTPAADSFAGGAVGERDPKRVKFENNNDNNNDTTNDTSTSLLGGNGTEVVKNGAGGGNRNIGGDDDEDVDSDEDEDFEDAM